MKGKSQKNNRGSVLLAVVCMTMVCITLATVALSIVNYTTKVSNRNVQRTQAKITAEAALTEFINYYHSIDANYNDLKTIASSAGSSRDTAYEVSVQMAGDPNFADHYGDCKIYVYNADSGFKVEAVCTYATQTQTASVKFKTTAETPYTPSNTLSSRNGAELNGGVATPVDGDVYIEKCKDGSSTYNKVETGNGATYTGHFYTDYNLKLVNSGVKFVDGINKNLAANTTTTNDDAYYHDTDYFKQAPTITVNGYITSANDGVSITTEVGKTNVEGKNSDDYATEAEYQAVDLSNKDGYVFAMKKFVISGNSFTVGSANRPIDIYCRGAYFGPLPAYIDGVATDRDEIISGFDNSIEQYDSRSYTFNGNFYCYKGTSSGEYQNGALVITENNNQGPIFNGDCFVDGDIYLVNSKLTVTGTLYCTGNIYECTGDVYGGSVNTTHSAKISFNSSTGKYVIESSDGFDYSRIITNGKSGNTDGSKLGNYIPTNHRNTMPADGYDPALNITSSTRKGLSVYDESTPNNMYKASQENLSLGNGVNGREAAKYISDKYQMAMTRTLSDTYTKLDGTTGQVSEVYSASANIIQINASVRLSIDQVNNSHNVVTGAYQDNCPNNYLIDITDEDIVICLPMGHGSSDGDIKAKFRINRQHEKYETSPATGEYVPKFVYFMFYDKDDPSICYYYDQDHSEVTRDGKTFTGKAPTQAQIDSAVIHFVKGNHEGFTIADYDAIGIVDPASNFSSSTPSSDIFNNYNYTMILIPDGVDFRIGPNGVNIHAIIYGPNADVYVEGSHSTVYGKINCWGFYKPQDVKDGVVQECREAKGSILGYVDAANSISVDTKIQYYEY